MRIGIISTVMVLAVVSGFHVKAEEKTRNLHKETPIKVDERYLGTWVETENCEKHPKWPKEMKFTKDKKNSKVILVWRGGGDVPFNIGSEIVDVDIEKEKFRTYREVVSFDNGRTVIMGSTWKPINPKKGDGVSTISTVYKLNSMGDTLTYEKYGFSAFEENGNYTFGAYSEQFPKNYHCEFKKKI